jgi:hypothetical protein
VTNFRIKTEINVLNLIPCILQNLFFPIALQQENVVVKFRKMSFSERNDYNHILAKENRPRSLTFLNAKSFASLVKSSTVLADKSLFIFNLLENYLVGNATLLFALPPGTGKTMLLTMLCDFLTEKGNLEGRVFDEQFEKGYVLFYYFRRRI